MVGVEAEAVTAFAVVEMTRVSVVPSPPVTVSAVVKFAVKVMESLPEPAVTESAPELAPMTKVSLPTPPVTVVAVAPAIVALTPAPTNVFPEESKVSTVEPSVPKVRPMTPVTFNFVVAAKVLPAKTLVVEPAETSVNVSTPATTSVALLETLLRVIVAESAEPVTLLNVTVCAASVVSRTVTATVEARPERVVPNVEDWLETLVRPVEFEKSIDATAVVLTLVT